MASETLMGLAGINYELGCAVPFRTIPDHQQRLAELNIHGDPRDTGLDQFREISGEVFDRVITCATRTLEDSPIDPDDVDAVMLCTSTFLRAIDHDRHNIAHFLRATGLHDAFHFGLTFTTCATLPTALQIAEALIARGRFRNVLVAIVECYTKEWPTFVSQSSRLTRSYVCSDGVASFLLTSSAGAEYQLLDVSLKAKTALLDPPTANESTMIQYLDLLRSTYFGCLHATDLAGRQLRKVFTGNYFYPIVDSFRCALGLEADQLFRENIVRVGHCYSADTLINLKDYADDQGRHRGDLFCLLSTGVGQLGAAILRAT